MFRFMCKLLNTSKIHFIENTSISSVNRFKYSAHRGYAASPNIQFNYKDEELKQILETINNKENKELVNYDISKGRIQKIQNWKTKNGSFTDIDQLLNLEGFGLKIIEKFCNSILKTANNVNVKPKVKENLGRSILFTTPPLYEETRCNVKSCVAIHTGVNSLSWARLHLIDENIIKVDNWNIIDLGEKKLHISELIHGVTFANYSIPHADVYIFENPQIAQSGGHNSAVQININVQRSQLIAMISLALMSRELNEHFYRTIEKTGKIDNESIPTKVNRSVFFLRQFLTSKLYGTVIGSERVSNIDIVLNLLRTQYNIENCIKSVENQSIEKETNSLIKLDVEHDPRKNYSKVAGYHKEYMGNALLIGLTFLRLCIMKDKKAIQAVTGGRSS